MANKNKMVDGKLVELTNEEQAKYDAEQKAWADGQADRDLAELRRQRNQLLTETDYMGNSDVTMTDAWKTYRQELRDITKTFKSMSDKDFKFPTKPTE
jgi:hypothetical protein